MKKRLVDDKRAVIADDQSSKVAEPSHAALDDPAVSVTAQHATVLRRSSIPIGTVRRNQGDPTAAQPFTQRVAVIGLVGNHPGGLLSWPSAVVPPPDADRGQGFFRQPDLGRRGRVKSDSQRNAAAVDHHHPLRPLAPLGFPDGRAPFLAGAKLPSKNDSLHFNCWRSFNSARNVRQMRSQTPCSSQSRNRRQHVDGEGNSLGKSCQRAPLRRIHKMPSNTLRFAAGGRPPRRCRRGRGSKGSISCHCASVSKRPYRRIRPPPGAVPPPRETQLTRN
jgi:hypothetical protein